MTRRSPTGGYKWCAVCGKYTACRLPQAKFHPGDGSLVLPFAHRDQKGDPCEGRWRDAAWKRPDNAWGEE